MEFNQNGALIEESDHWLPKREIKRRQKVKKGLLTKLREEK
jgi:hypothetical protein